MSRVFARARLGLVAAGAFFGGLIVAAGVNLTPFGYAQQQATAPKPSAQEVKPLADASQAFVSIADHVTPAVVAIQTERRASTRTNPRLRGQVPPGLEEFFDQFDPRRPQQQPSRGSGSGFIVSPDGYILTNNHVVADADRVNVTLMDKRVFKARVVGRDPSTDVAVLKIDGERFPAVTFGNDLNTRVGEWVLAIGNPLGLDFTVTAGIVSAKGRSGELRGLYESSFAIVDYIQTDAAINPGNSGGPLVNIRGEVIGINSAIASQTGFYAGYGFAIPITLAKSVMEDLIAHGRVRRAVLGIAINEVTPEDAEAAGLKEIRGARVDGFSDESSPAERAGIEPGDVIVAINGQPVERVAALQRIVRGFEPGQKVTVDVMRYGERKSFPITLAEAPQETQVASIAGAGDRDDSSVSNAKLGISVEPIPVELARQANLDAEARGLLVREVDLDGPANQQLFARTDVIAEVLRPAPRRQVKTVADLERALSRVRDGEIVSLYVYNIGGRRDGSEPQGRVVNLRVGGD
ncbi:MAG: Do family serine endopeptidase [Gemmatimonadaceae bacterium]